jgi:hypothetical protein
LLEVDRLAFGFEFWASSFCTRFLVASISARDDDGMPRRAITSSPPRPRDADFSGRGPVVSAPASA